MAAVSVTNIRLLNNPCPLSAPFVFEIHFEAQQALTHDVEWRVVYVGSGQHHRAAPPSPPKDKPEGAAARAAGDEASCMQAEEDAAKASCGSRSSGKNTASRGADYVLDSVLLGPVERGALAFEFAVNAPDFTQMDPGSVEGMQAVLVCGLYRGQEFVRIGYYLNNAYSDPSLRECPPEVPIYDRLVRCVVDAPRVTRFPINWGDEEESQPPVSSSETKMPQQQQMETVSTPADVETAATEPPPPSDSDDVRHDKSPVYKQTPNRMHQRPPTSPKPACKPSGFLE